MKGSRGACAFLFLAFSVGDARAADEAEFFVVANSLHAEAERAEICLALNQSISLDRGALAAALRLKKDGVRIPVAARDLSVTPAEFCVQQLEHRHRYQLAMEELQDREGRELAKAVNLSFTVPNRKPSLTLVSQASAFGLPRVTKDKSSSWTQTAVNVKAARLTLYRLEDRSKFAAAWQHYAQLGLTPSESFTFASQNGQQVWQHDLTFDGKPDVEQSRDVPLPSDLPPGLYFLASMPQTATTANPSLFAGAWFLVSDLKLAVLSGADGLHVVGTDAAVKRVLPGVQLQASASDGRVLAEAKSGADGAAKLALAQDRLAEAAFVTGVTAAGDVVIVDLAGMLKAKALDPTMEALMVPDRALYQPGSTAKVLLLARDEKGRARKVANSQLRLLRPDRSLFSEQTVPSEKAGAALLDVSLPTAAEAGAWTLVWQQAEGKVLTEASVALSAEPKGAKLEMTADRAGLDQDGLVTLTVKAVDLQGKPLPWRLGQVSWQEARPVFAGWKSYDFGASPRSLPEDKPVEFMTGAEGSARVQLKLPVEATPRSPAVAFKAQMIHAAEPTLLTLPVRSGAEWVGIRAQDGVKPFPENSMAAFDVVALDNNGKRRATGELFFQVFEEGRRFEWYQADGRWNYKPLPQHRRIGGGRFAIAANAENILRWPVTAGQYVLEIRNAEGDILAQYPFDAGRGAVSGVEGGEGRFVLQPPSSSPEPKRESRFVVKLAEPAMVVLTMADGRTRQTIHRFLPAGESALGFMPTEDWGRRLQIQAEALFAGGSRPAVAQLTLPLRHSSQELGLEIPVPPIVASGTMFPLPVTVQKNAGKSPVFLSALVTPMPADGTTALAGVAQTFVQTERDGKAQLRFAVPEFSGSLRLTLAAWNEGQAAVKTLTVPAKPAVAFNVEPPRYLAVGDQVSFNVAFENVTGADGNYTYNLVLPEGLKVGGASKGTVALKRGKSHAVNLTLTGARPLEDVLWLELEGPNNFHASRPWPISVRADRPQSLKFTAQKIEPQQTLTVSPVKTRKGVEEATVLVSPVPLAEAPRRLQTLLDFDPFTTMELAQWLNVSWLWRAEIASFGLMGEGNLKDEQASRLKQLLQRQKGDGGFSAFPSGAESDMTSTSAALIALRDDEPQAATQAAQWLQRKLENTWFDEGERGPRAAAFLALSMAKRADLSALRYFAETSKEKEMTPAATAQLALAVALNRDQETARFWIARARPMLAALMTRRAHEAAEILAFLSLNPLVEPKDLFDDLENATRLENSMALLQAVGALRERLGEWRVSVNGDERKQEGLIRLPRPEKNSLLTLLNPSKEKLYVLQVEEGGGKASGKDDAEAEAPLSLQRQFYRLDGERLEGDASFETGKTYLLLVRGAGKVDGKTEDAVRLMTLPASAGLQPLAYGSAEAFAALWPWLPPLTTVESASLAATGLSLALKPTSEWRVAFLVKAGERGRYTLPSITVRELNDKAAGASLLIKPLPAAQPALKIQVR